VRGNQTDCSQSVIFQLQKDRRLAKEGDLKKHGVLMLQQGKKKKDKKKRRAHYCNAKANVQQPTAGIKEIG